MSKKDDVFEQIIERAKKDGSYYATYSTKKHMSKKDEALKQSLITEAAIQSKDHPSKDARTFAKSVHEYLMAEQPAQHDPSVGTQVNKVWWDGEKLVAKQVPLEDFYKPAQQEPVPEKFMDALKFDVAQRTWVDLTVEEIQDCCATTLTPFGLQQARALLDKFKEKNT